MVMSWQGLALAEVLAMGPLQTAAALAQVGKQ
jgi:hypothetical protein